MMQVGNNIFLVGILLSLIEMHHNKKQGKFLNVTQRNIRSPLNIKRKCPDDNLFFHRMLNPFTHQRHKIFGCHYG